MESFRTRFMGRQGPCLHCGINESSLWITGPSGKPVLCNACGSTWQTRGTLDDYIPNHANREIPSNQLPSEMEPHLVARDDQRLKTGVEVSGQDGSSACLETEMNNISSLGSAGSSSHNFIQMEETNGEAGKYPLWNPDSVPKWKRSKLRKHILSPVERLQRQLLTNLQGPDFEDIAVDDDTVTLIYAQNKYIPPNEIGLGAMLFVSPTTTTEPSTSLSPMAVDNASCSMNVPVENSYLIYNNLQDHVALQNQATGNEGGNASAHENALSPPPMDITSRVSGQTSQGARGGSRRGPPVRRPRGRPPRSTTRGR